jgi:hypothetical protein
MFHLHQVHFNEDGTPKRWVVTCERARIKLGVEQDFKPWTGRGSTVMDGNSKQAVQPNFLHELADILWMQNRVRLSLPYDSEAPSSLMMDCRQDIRYNHCTTAPTMLVLSRLYHFSSDRCLCPEEHVYFQGWGLDTTMSEVAKTDLTKFGQTEEAPAKKRRGRKPDIGPRLSNLAGNGECLPDLAVFSLSVIYGISVGQFQHDHSHADLDLLADSSLSHVPDRHIRVVNHDADTSIASALGDTCGDVSDGSFSDFEQ